MNVNVNFNYSVFPACDNTVLSGSSLTKRAHSETSYDGDDKTRNVAAPDPIANKQSRNDLDEENDDTIEAEDLRLPIDKDNLHAQSLAASLALAKAPAQPLSLAQFIGAIEAEKILKFFPSNKSEQLKEDSKDGKTTSADKEDRPSHIRRNVFSQELGGPLKCSLISVPNGPTIVLLKGKAYPGTEASLRANGIHKTVKPAFNLESNLLCANCGYDVDAGKAKWADEYGIRGTTSKARLLAAVQMHSWMYEDVVRQVLKAETGPEASTVLNSRVGLLKYFEKMENDLISDLIGKAIEASIRQEVDKEYILHGESDLPATYKTEYRSSITREGQISARERENKPIRITPHSIISFFVPLAEGAVSNPVIQKRIVSNPLHLSSCVEDMATGLQRLHEKKIAHLDIKLENLLFIDGRAVWSDFGCAQRFDTQQVKFWGDMVISDPIALSAALAAGGEAQLDLSSADIYSLGLAFFKLLTGKYTDYQYFRDSSVTKNATTKKNWVKEAISTQLSNPGSVDWNAIDAVYAEMLSNRSKEIRAEIDKFHKSRNLQGNYYEDDIIVKLMNVECPGEFAKLIVNMLKIDADGAKNRPKIKDVVDTINALKSQNNAWLSIKTKRFEEYTYNDENEVNKIGGGYPRIDIFKK